MVKVIHVHLLYEKKNFCFRHLRHPSGGGGGDNQEQPVACRIEGRERQNHEAGDDYTIAPDSRL